MITDNNTPGNDADTDPDMKTDSDTDTDIQRMLANIRLRHRPPSEAQDRVYAAVHASWESMAPQDGATTAPRTWPQFAVAAAVAVLAVGALLFSNLSRPAPAIGDIAFASGAYSVSGGSPGVAAESDTGRLVAGSSVRTSTKGRVFIRLAAGATVRLDGATRATLNADRSIHLHEGRLYIDSHGPASDVSVTTPHATITRVGTQFEVVARDDALSVAVREGKVNVALAGATLAAQAASGVGEELRFDGARMLSRTAVSASDERWGWTQKSRPRFAHASHSVYDYLEWFARENGRQLKMSVRAERVARNQRLEGVDSDATDADLRDVMRMLNDELQERDGAAHELVIDLSRS